MRTIICLQKRFFLHTKKIYPDIGLATVYRNLELLEKLGIIHRFDYGDGQSRYEISLGGEEGEHYHHHLICRECGAIGEFKSDLLETIEKRIAEDTGFAVTDHCLRFFLVSAPPVKRNGNLDKKQVRVYYIGNIKGVDGGE